MQVPELKKCVEKLYQWQYGVRDPNDFTYQLFTLLQMANSDEFAKLEKAYPCEARAYRLWYASKDPVGFFTSHDVWKGPRKSEYASA